MGKREIIDWLADHPASSSVCKRLSHMLVARIRGWSEEEAAILAARERDLEDELLEVEARLWKSIMSTDLSPAAEGRQRLLTGLIRERHDPLDWYLAEFLIFWCENAGVPREDILADFRDCLQL